MEPTRLVTTASDVPICCTFSQTVLESPVLIRLSHIPELGNEYILSDGRTAIFDFNDGLHFGITCSDGEAIGFNYSMGVTDWLEWKVAKMIKQGEGGFSDWKECRICRRFFGDGK